MSYTKTNVENLLELSDIGYLKNKLFQGNYQDFYLGSAETTLRGVSRVLYLKVVVCAQHFEGGQNL